MGNRGEIWWVDLEPGAGAEQKKVRPCVVLSLDSTQPYNALRIIVPITKWKSHFARAIWMIRVNPNKTNGLNQTKWGKQGVASAIDAFQVRAVDSTQRFIKKIGILPDPVVDNIVIASAICMGYPKPII